MDLLLDTPSDSNGLVGLATSEGPASSFILSTGWMRIAASSLFNMILRDMRLQIRRKVAVPSLDD